MPEPKDTLAGLSGKGVFFWSIKSWFLVMPENVNLCYFAFQINSNFLTGNSMKYLKSYSVFFFLFWLSLLTGCTPERWGNGIQLSDDTETSQVYYADETYGQNIRFTASGPWYAEVDETEYVIPDEEHSGNRIMQRSDEVDWVTLSQYEGQEAGEYTVVVSLRVNTTGTSRTADITFHCGDSETVVSVEQQAYTADGEIPGDEGPGGQPEVTTVDGKYPYLRMDDDALLLPSMEVSEYEVLCHTNIYRPIVRVEDAFNGKMAEFLSSENRNDSVVSLFFQVYENPGDEARTATMLFQDEKGRVYGKFELRQEAYVPQVELVQVKSEVGSLTFQLKAGPSVRGVLYRLKDKPEAPGHVPEEDQYYSLDSQETFELSFDGLMPATTYYLYLTAELEYGMDKSQELPATTAVLESKYDLVFEVSANPANNYTVYLPAGTSGQLQGTVDWGDGQTSQYESNPSAGVKHVYDVTEPTTFEVRFSGILTNLSFSNAGGVAARENTLLAIRQWGYTGLEQINLSDAGCLTYLAPDTERAFRNVQHFGVEPYGGSFTNTGIEAIPEGFFDAATQATSFDYTFGGCTKLKELPAGLFRNAVKAETFSRTFIGCVQLQSIPADLFANCREAYSFNTTFAGCSALEEIPAGLFAHTVKAYYFEATFSGCSSLKSIPADLFANCPNACYFGQCSQRSTDPRGGGLGCFQNCSSLTSIPEGLFANNKKVKDLSYTFGGCRQLTDVPAGLFANCTDAAYMEGTFQYCSALQQVPAGLFDQNRRIVHLGKLFESSGLQCESPYTLVDGVKVHLYEREQYSLHFVAPVNHYECFRNCQDMTDYESVPANWK